MSSVAPRELYATRRSGRSRTRRRSSRVSPWMRAGFFALAALWGFGLGVAALGFVMSRTHAGFALDGSAVGPIALGAAVAAVGGAVASGAYREARSRRRS